MIYKSVLKYSVLLTIIFFCSSECFPCKNKICCCHDNAIKNPIFKILDRYTISQNIISFLGGYDSAKIYDAILRNENVSETFKELVQKCVDENISELNTEDAIRYVAIRSFNQISSTKNERDKETKLKDYLNKMFSSIKIPATVSVNDLRKASMFSEMLATSLEEIINTNGLRGLIPQNKRFDLLDTFYRIQKNNVIEGNHSCWAKFLVRYKYCLKNRLLRAASMPVSLTLSTLGFVLTSQIAESIIDWIIGSSISSLPFLTYLILFLPYFLARKHLQFYDFFSDDSEKLFEPIIREMVSDENFMGLIQIEN